MPEKKAKGENAILVSFFSSENKTEKKSEFMVGLSILLKERMTNPHSKTRITISIMSENEKAFYFDQMEIEEAVAGHVTGMAPRGGGPHKKISA